ncbi:MAG: glycosyltransferase, partial [Hungatella sp.]
MKVPIISVIMSTYNEEENYLREAIESVLTQTYSDFEFLIVLDNPSNAMIRMVVQQYANQDERIRVLPNDKNMGLTHSLNRALRCVRGQFVSRMDADDRMGQNCLKRELEMIVAEELDLVSASKINMDEQGKLKGKYINSVSPEQMKWLLPYDNMVNHPTVLVRTKSILREGGYRNIISCEDYDLWIRMLCHGCRMKVIPEVLLFYRRR